MAEEFNAHGAYDTWDLMSCDPNKGVISHKWVYVIRYYSGSNFEQNNALLVVRGDHQEIGIHFTKTFSHVIKYATIWLVQSSVVSLNCPLSNWMWKMSFYLVTSRRKSVWHDLLGYSPNNFMTMFVNWNDPFMAGKLLELGLLVSIPFRMPCVSNVVR